MSVYIVDGVRTPIAKFRGALSSVRSDDLAALLIKHLADKHRLQDTVEEVFMGSTNQAGEDNRNIARMALLLAGLKDTVTGVTVNRLCGSGMEAVIQASRAIAVGDMQVAIAGGVESMSRAPYVMAKAEEALPRTPPAMYDTSLGWRFPNPKLAERFPLLSMGETAEQVAREHHVTREAQDAFALSSHQKASKAISEKKFADEIVAVPTPTKANPGLNFFEDECPRKDASMEALSKLKAVFQKDGSVTAGNSSPLNDGASALLLMGEAALKSSGNKPLVRIVGTAAGGLHPNVMGLGPIVATQKLFAKSGLSAKDMDVIEINEAFAAQALPCIKVLGLDPERVNVNGGGIALGHPIGSSGGRILVTLAHEMKRRKAKYGLATLCIGVGQGLAVIVENSSN